MHRQINPQPTCQFTADQVSMALTIIEGLPHHTWKSYPVIVEDCSFRNVNDFEACCVETRTKFVIRSRSGSPHTLFVNPVELHQQGASHCKIGRDIAAFPRSPLPGA